MTNKQPQYDENFKKNIVALHQNGKTQTELSKEYGISVSANSRWIKLYSEVKVDDLIEHFYLFSGEIFSFRVAIFLSFCYNSIGKVFE